MLDSIAIRIHHTIIPIEKPGYSLRIYPKIWLPDVTLCHHFGTRTVQIELRDSQSKRESLQNPMKIDEEQLNIVTRRTIPVPHVHRFSALNYVSKISPSLEIVADIDTCWRNDEQIQYC